MRQTSGPSWSVFDGFASPRPTAVAPPTWSIFDGFQRPPRRRVTWQTLDEFLEAGRVYAAERCWRFPALLAEWDKIMIECDGDPSRADWSHFRPLHVDREEDWSDWLQHFIATSTTGTLGWLLFNRSELPAPEQCIGASVLREDVIDDRRADLVITWRDATRTHIEVKVGDRAFAKTAETASKLEQKYPAPRWSHYVLLPDEDVLHWDAIDHPELPVINIVTWDDVAVALRRSLRVAKESRRWRSWAHGFCGLIEQRLLGHPLATSSATSLTMLGRRMHQMSIMRRGLDDV